MCKHNAFYTCNAFLLLQLPFLILKELLAEYAKSRYMDSSNSEISCSISTVVFFFHAFLFSFFFLNDRLVRVRHLSKSCTLQEYHSNTDSTFYWCTPDEWKAPAGAFRATVCFTIEMTLAVIFQNAQPNVSLCLSASKFRRMSDWTRQKKKMQTSLELTHSCLVISDV